jgi:hypothetical protein
MAITNIDMPTFPVYVAYDTAADPQVIGADADHSVIMPAPSLLHIEAVPVGTTLTLQAKCHKDATWATLGTYTSVNTPAFVSIQDKASCTPHVPNFVQVVRSVDDGDVKVYAQV